MTEYELPPKAKELRPIPKHIYDHLTKDGVSPLEFGDIIGDLGYDPDSVSRACSDLLEAGLVEKQYDTTDGRVRRYAPIGETEHAPRRGQGDNSV